MHLLFLSEVLCITYFHIAKYGGYVSFEILTQFVSRHSNTIRSNYSLTLCTQWAHELNPSEAVVKGIFWPQHDRAGRFSVCHERGMRSSGEGQRLGPHAHPFSRGPPGPESSSIDRWFMSLVSLFLTLPRSLRAPHCLAIWDGSLLCVVQSCN